MLILAVPVTALGTMSQSICLGLSTFPLNSFFHLCVFYCALPLPKVSHNFGIWLRQACDVLYPPTLFFLKLVKDDKLVLLFFSSSSFSPPPWILKLGEMTTPESQNSMPTQYRTSGHRSFCFSLLEEETYHLRTRSLWAVFYTTF